MLVLSDIFKIGLYDRDTR